MSQAKNAQADQFFQDFSDLARENMNAFVKSSALLFKGYEEIAQTTASIVQSTAEKQIAYANKAIAAKTVKEWTEAQNAIAQANFDDFVAGVTKISDISIKVLSDAAKPLSPQATKAGT